MPKGVFRNEVGIRYENLVIQIQLPRQRCIIQCDCGVTKEVNIQRVRMGLITSCGCTKGYGEESESELDARSEAQWEAYRRRKAKAIVPFRPAGAAKLCADSVSHLANVGSDAAYAAYAADAADAAAARKRQIQRNIEFFRACLLELQ